MLAIELLSGIDRLLLQELLSPEWETAVAAVSSYLSSSAILRRSLLIASDLS